MQRSAAGLILWTGGTTIDGKRKSVRSPHVEKIAKGATTLPRAFGLLLPFNGKVLSAQEHGTQVAKGPLGTVERSEEHTSELQSLTNLVCRLLLEKKKKEKEKK